MRISDWSSDVCSSDLPDQRDDDQGHQRDLRADPGSPQRREREGVQAGGLIRRHDSPATAGGRAAPRRWRGAVFARAYCREGLPRWHTVRTVMAAARTEYPPFSLSRSIQYYNCRNKLRIRLLWKRDEQARPRHRRGPEYRHRREDEAENEEAFHVQGADAE